MNTTFTLKSESATRDSQTRLDFDSAPAKKAKTVNEKNANQATAKLEWIREALASGKTVYIHTHTRITVITPKSAARFEASGRPLFKTAGTSIYLSVGKRYDCIDYCGITAAY